MTLGKMILKKHKAVSPVIATILLIALTVTAAAIVYFVVVPLLRGKPTFVFTSFDRVLGDTTRYEFTVENQGTAAGEITALTSFTIKNVTGDYTPIQAYQADGTTPLNFTDTLTIVQADSLRFIIELDGIFTSGSSYTFELTYNPGNRVVTAELGVY